MSKNQVQTVWGTPILDDGFANVPNMLIRNYRKLGVTHGEFGLVMQLISYKHDAGDPFPSQETLGNNLDVDTRAIRKLLSSLEGKGLIEVEHQYLNGKRSSNIYVLKPLIDKCLSLYGEKPLPEPTKYKSFKKKKKSLQEQEVPVVEEREVPVGLPPKVPVGSEREVPSNITREYNKDNITNEYNNLSIKEEIELMDMPLPIQKTLIQNTDRLIDDSISIDSILDIYNAYQDKLNEHEYSLVLSNVLEDVKGKIGNIKKVMIISIKNHLKEPQQAENKPENSNDRLSQAEMDYIFHRETHNPGMTAEEEAKERDELKILIQGL